MTESSPDPEPYQITEPKSPDQILRDCADRYALKNESWGDSWKETAKTMNQLLPEMHSEEEWQQIICIMLITLKLHRATQNFPNSLSLDSLADLSTYTAMLASIQKPDNK